MQDDPEEMAADEPEKKIHARGVNVRKGFVDRVVEGSGSVFRNGRGQNPHLTEDQRTPETIWTGITIVRRGRYKNLASWLWPGSAGGRSLPSGSRGGER